MNSVLSLKTRSVNWIHYVKNSLLWAFISHELLMLFGSIVRVSHASPNPGAFETYASPWLQWDSLWYLAIGHYGYMSMPDGTSLKATAFFPFIPVLSHFLGKWAVLLLGQVIFFISLVLLKRLFLRNGFSEVKSNIATWLFALNPAAIYYTAVYAEPWTVFFVLLSVTFATNKRWLWAGVSGALASSTQAVGILVGAFPLILFIQSLILGEWKRVRDATIWGGISTGGLIVYMVYLAVQFHNPIEFSTVQSGVWGAHWEWPWVQFKQALTWILVGHHMFTGITTFCLCILVVGAAVQCARTVFSLRRSWEAWSSILYVFIGLWVALSFYEGLPFHNALRISSMYFPIYGGLAALRPKLLIWLTFLAFASVAFVGGSLFSHQLWFQ